MSLRFSKLLTAVCMVRAVSCQLVDLGTPPHISLLLLASEVVLYMSPSHNTSRHLTSTPSACSSSSQLLLVMTHHGEKGSQIRKRVQEVQKR